ncbi:MAG: energy-coupling factor ABC transporter ATP-binding protein [Clostridiales Family XIII bacterium]|jgi:cobalt/nickel transport system ATP-binding protein|nr:energy-coupling factor ABC transporter ATP-binding protein [Clostridiales Family XIII bacterium]
MLQVNDLTVKYDEKDASPVLDSLSFTIGDGEKVALIGANGAGKSTLMLSLVGVLTPTGGGIVLKHDDETAPEHTHTNSPKKHVHDTVRVDRDHHDRKTIGQLRSHIGMLFQNPDDQIFMPLVKDDIAFGPANYKEDPAATERRMDEILARLGISGLKDRLSTKLSDGEKRLVGLAGVLIMNPFILMLDEPFTFLDRRAQRTLAEILKGLNHTLLLATHDFHLAQNICGRTILLHKGKVAADGPSKEILDDEDLLRRCGL